MPSLAAGRALDRASQSAAPGPAGAPSIRRPGTTVHASSCSRAPTTLCALLAEHLSGFRIQGSGHGVYTVAALSRLACMFVAEGVVCLLYTSDAADDLLCVDLGGRRI